MSVAFLAAVFISNLPEALSSTAVQERLASRADPGPLDIGHRGVRALFAGRLRPL